MKNILVTFLLFGTLFGSLPAHADSQVSEFSPTPLMTQETLLLVQLLEHAHYTGKAVSELDFDELIVQFMQELDYNRLFFTAEERDDFIERFGSTLHSHLFQGKLDSAFQIIHRYRINALERLDWVNERLEGNFNFDTDLTYSPDRRKAEWPENREAADDVWERRLKYEMLQQVLNEKEIDEAKELITRRYDRMRRMIREIDALEAQETFLTSLTKMYDPHSTYLSSDTMDNFNISMRLSLVGIGAMLTSEDGYCVIRELVPGGPADLSNEIQPEDRIVSVAQEGEEPVDVIDMKLQSVVNMIRGQKQTPVTLTLIPADATDSSVRKEVTLIRDEIRLTASRARAKIFEVPDEDGKMASIGVIEVPSFYGANGRDGSERVSTTEDVEALIHKLEDIGIDGLVLDLRRNGGGLLSEAIKMTGIFIGTGPVVQVRSSDGRVQVTPDNNPNISYSGPLGILVSRHSASASEIVAGALQSYRRAVVIGESSTHGKGTVQAVFELGNYLPRSPHSQQRTGATKLTVQKFYLPDGESTQNRGVLPDVSIPSFNDYLPIGESDLPNAMLWDTLRNGDWEEVRANTTVTSPVTRKHHEALLELSRKRQETLEEFQYWDRNIDWFRTRQEQKAVSLNLTQRTEQRERDEAFREEMKKVERQLARNDYSFQKILLDGVESDESTPATAHPPATPSIDANGEDEEEEEGGTLDIHLRESLRVLNDLIRLKNDQSALATTHRN